MIVTFLYFNRLESWLHLLLEMEDSYICWIKFFQRMVRFMIRILPVIPASLLESCSLNLISYWVRSYFLEYFQWNLNVWARSFNDFNIMYFANNMEDRHLFSPISLHKCFVPVVNWELFAPRNSHFEILISFRSWFLDFPIKYTTLEDSLFVSSDMIFPSIWFSYQYRTSDRLNIVIESLILSTFKHCLLAIFEFYNILWSEGKFKTWDVIWWVAPVTKCYF